MKADLDAIIGQRRRNEREGPCRREKLQSSHVDTDHDADRKVPEIHPVRYFSQKKHGRKSQDRQGRRPRMSDEPEKDPRCRKIPDRDIEPEHRAGYHPEDP